MDTNVPRPLRCRDYLLIAQKNNDTSVMVRVRMGVCVGAEKGKGGEKAPRGRIKKKEEPLKQPSCKSHVKS